MAVKMRLARRGRKKQPFYHIVIADARAPRDGRFIEKIGSYNPMTSPATIEIDRDRAYEWLRNGAQPTDTVRSILRFKGVLYKKHLMRGVDKGALTVEEAEAKLEAWIADKEARIQARREKVAEERKAFLAMVSGEAPKPKAKAPQAAAGEEDAPKREAPKTLAEEFEAKAAAEAEEAAASEEAPLTEEAPAAEETPAVDDTPAAEAEAEAEAEVAEETPAAEQTPTEEAAEEE